MAKTFSATQARIHFGELMLEAQKGPVVVEKDGKPQVVVLSKQAYDTLVDASPPGGWRELLHQAHQSVQAELSGRQLPPPEEMILQDRKDRDERQDALR